MAEGYLALVLHAHLPFVRHPEAPSYMEEEWLFEAITETYIPLIWVFENLVRDEIDFRLTLSVSPPLLTMLTDDLLRERYTKKLDLLVELATREVERTKNDWRFRALSSMYQDRFLATRECWQRYDGDLSRAFRRFQEAGKVELVTCTGTHPFAPMLDRNWAVLRAQVNIAAETAERTFGRRTAGMWLGECGYVHGIDELLREEGIRYFFLDTHGLLFADTRPIYGCHAPVYCPTGVAAFARDVESSRQVWSSKEGYPGDPVYRDFYRDIGFDLDESYIGPYIHPDGIRTYTGIKYHAITHGKLHDKHVYDPYAAWRRADEHATHFLNARVEQVKHLSRRMDRKPVVVAPYDAELFGHWWYEGPIFLEMLFRKMQHDQAVVEPITPSGYLVEYPINQVTTPCTSSWGFRGYGEYWCNGTNAWVYRHLHKMGERMVELAQRFPHASSIQTRALNQAARELMLAQSSDWAFIMRSGTTDLRLHSNQLTGSIPPELGNLASLGLLWLYSNQLTGSIPPELGNLGSLTTLSLHSNQLTGSLPPEFGNLGLVEETWLQSNHLSGCAPGSLGGLISVKNISLKDNALSQAGVDSCIGDVYAKRTSYTIAGKKTLNISGTNATPSAAALAQVTVLEANHNWDIICTGGCD